MLSTKQRERLFLYLFDNSQKKININAIAREEKLSVGLVHKYVKILEGMGLIVDGWLVDNSITRMLRVVRNHMKIQDADLVNRLRKLVPRAKGIGIYGSWSDGTNRSDSDIDIWINVNKDIDDLALSRMNKDMSNIMDSPVDILVATPERMKHLRENAESLYHSIYHSLLLWGEKP